MRSKLLAAAVLAIPMLLAGCVTSEIKPIPKIAAKQATVHIPQAELLDVGIRVFDPGIPKNLENDDEALAKKRIYPDLRKAEARYMPDAAALDARRNRAVGRGARHPEHRGFRRRHRHGQGGRFERRLHGRRHQRRRCRGPRVDQGQALQQPGRSRRLQDHRLAQGARSFPERLLRNRQRPGRRARQALGARSRKHPQGRQPQVRRRISRPMPCRA